MFHHVSLSRLTRFGLAVALVALLAVPAMADGGVQFNDIAEDPATGITYERTPSERIEKRQALIDAGPVPIPEFRQRVGKEHPMKPRGNPGVALLDYDGDGDLDIYVTNGPGSANSLYSNQLRETGSVTFVDNAAAAGVTLTAQDSSGVCFGDIDNDGDQDLYVVGSDDPNHLLRNNGDGTFTDITAAAGVGGDALWGVDCAMGDINNDGLLDIGVANTYDSWYTRTPIIDPGPYDGFQHNYLFVNQGGNVFVDAAEAAGLHNVSNLPGAAWTWVFSMVDMDLDGDLDVVTADNQGARPRDESERRGFNRLMRNDGTGNFTDETFAVGLDIEGGWMGLAFADYDCNGYMDFFSTNLGSYGGGPTAGSAFFMGQPDGTYTWVNPINPFGWGTSPIDYDNDGDHDVIYHGSVDNVASVVADNPGVLYTNLGNCSGEFVYDQEALVKDHRLRTVNGVAVGDLDQDGFQDIVSVSNFDIEPINFFPWVPIISPPKGSIFDNIAAFEVEWFPLDGANFSYVDPVLPNGTLSIELNSGGTGYGSATIDPVGMVGLLPNGRVNRDGTGAVVRFHVPGVGTSMLPIAAGTSYSSQDAQVAHFGLGDSNRGHVEIIWPGGVKNRLYNVRPGENVVFPEIPCSYDDRDRPFREYLWCVTTSLDNMVDAGVLERTETNRFLMSALRAYGFTLADSQPLLDDSVCSRETASPAAALIAEAGEEF